MCVCVCVFINFVKARWPHKSPGGNAHSQTMMDLGPAVVGENYACLDGLLGVSCDTMNRDCIVWQGSRLEWDCVSG